ncbi:FAD-binding oxidoreductase [Streptomyces sp. JJ38]|uniref:FAD-binding oxidoreductase n=1 Tax=Streptomyces sp. JJ38 TaxID=2738128 RepID=UPI001C55E7EC|nr:FAD-binding oxidoreductase [Streptomyces sp. JJ38]MBW1600197.1 FAD-binding oxidoreductase [Streptomyces sp. JJ38]
MGTAGVETLSGPVFRPGDPGFEEEVGGYQTAYAHRPSLVVGAAHAEDIRRAVRYADAHGLPVAVQATGHGLSVAAEGGVLVSTRRMRGVTVDAEARTARIEAGARWEDVIAAAAPHGLAPLNGSSNTVGAVGYLLGGGIGLLARRYGYAAEHVRELEIVTADGERRRTVPGEELFGAVLGSGGNLGVVTSMEIGLFPLSTVYGGQLVFGEPHVEAVLEAWRRWTAEVPEELTSTLTLLTYPDAPEVPGHLRGRYVTSLRIAFDGPAAEGERLVRPLRAVGEPLEDELREMPYTECGTIHRDSDEPHPYTGTNTLLTELTPEATAAVLELAGPDAPVSCVVDFRHLGGALDRRGPGRIAVDHRRARYVVRVISVPGPGGDDPAAIREQHALLRKAFGPWRIGHCVNFLYGDGDAADETQTAQAFEPATYARLAALKAAYDPKNLFRFNRNVRPAAG